MLPSAARRKNVTAAMHAGALRMRVPSMRNAIQVKIAVAATATSRPSAYSRCSRAKWLSADQELSSETTSLDAPHLVGLARIDISYAVPAILVGLAIVVVASKSITTVVVRIMALMLCVRRHSRMPFEG
jgi:hypothetical protein